MSQNMGARKAKSKRSVLGRQLKRAQDMHARKLAARNRTTPAKRRELPDEQWLQEMRDTVRTISRQLDELEVIIRAMNVLENKRVVCCWYNNVVPALGARPIDLCQTARGRRAVLRELGRIEHGVH